MPPPVCMGQRRRIATLCTLTMVLLSTLSLAQSTAADQGALLDVHVFPGECITSGGCMADRPSHLIEYFSADWCEPCLETSQQLRALNRTDTLVVQHHPSPLDETFQPSSKMRFDQTYRLLFFPSMVVDGTDLLTGTRQAMDLGTTLNNSTTNWQGLNGLALNNSTLQWTPIANATVVVWFLQPTPHTSANTTHEHLVVKSWNENASTGWLNLSEVQPTTNSRLVVLLEREGGRVLNISSLAPMGNADLNLGEDSVPSENTAFPTPPMVAIGSVIVLLMLFAPALGWHLRIRNTPAPSFTENGTDEE